jgi:DNA-binding NarL/FixJ family response regulator
MTGQKILVVDDHPIFRDALIAALSTKPADFTFEQAENFDAVTQKLEQGADYDLVLLDLKMPGVQGFSGLVFLRGQYPSVPVVIVSGVEDAKVMRRALTLGAAGFIPKSTAAEVMRMAVHEILAGGTWVPAAAREITSTDAELDGLARRMASLTPQQLRVLMMVREGMLNKQIAFTLAVSEATIKAHVSAILLKLDVNSRTQAVIASARLDGD